MKENRSVGCTIFGAFPSYRIDEATKNVSVFSLFTVAISENYTREIRESFEATTYLARSRLLHYVSPTSVLYKFLALLLVITLADS